MAIPSFLLPRSKGTLVAGVVAGLVLSPVLLPVVLFFTPLLIALGIGGAALLGYLFKYQGTTLAELRFLWHGARNKVYMRWATIRNKTVDVIWDETVAREGVHTPCFVHIDTDRTYTFGDIERLSNRVANFALSQGIQPGQDVALFMRNRPEFVAIWLGLAKIGARTALINHNLRKQALIHSLTVSNCRMLLFEADYAEPIEDIALELADLPLPVSLFGFPTHEEQAPLAFCDLIDPLAYSPLALPAEERAAANGIRLKDPVLYIFTSGTTGMPKAAVITHMRYLLAGHAFATFAGVTSADRIYCSLPLYHSAAGMLGIGMLITSGCSMAIRQKFSASNFTRDVQRYDPTIIQYIGETARYLLGATPHPMDAENRIRAAIGNGLRPDVWERFQERFGIDQIMEFYGATEGATAILNTENQPFAVGYVPPLVRRLLPQMIVQYNVEEDEIVRDANGRCVPCAPGEVGEFIAKIMNVGGGASNFSGYTNAKSSAKKILENVFEDGDRWFRSGDLLRMDENHFFYFVDRIGDTFRWKGENVATSQVAETCSSFDPSGQLEFNVYGVQVGTLSGRAGMVGIIGSSPETFDFAAFAAHLAEELPAYARPLFIRFLPAMDLTGTYKHKKVRLRSEGFDPATIEDPLFFFDGQQYVPIDADLYARINSGEMRL